MDLTDVPPRRLAIGGIPPLEDIVGRDALRLACVRALDSGHGCRLTGDRRHGKTSLLRIVEASCRERNDAVVRISAERATLADFVQALSSQLSQAGSPVAAELDRWSLGVDFGILKADRHAAARTLDQLVSSTIGWLGGRRLYLLIDEVPILALRLERSEPGAGADFLHLLRRLRQDFSGSLDMALSGSIGFHHVTVSGVVNDVETVEVGPLRHEDAVGLAASLLLGETVPTTDPRGVAEAIADQAEAIPFYVHHLIKSAFTRAAIGRSVTPDVVPQLVEEALTHPDDPWDMKHYRRRIADYYGSDRADLVTAVLDIYADAGAAVGVDEVERLLAAVDLRDRPTRQGLADLVGLLEADHYLTRVGNASRWASELVCRAWLAQRR